MMVSGKLVPLVSCPPANTRPIHRAFTATLISEILQLLVRVVQQVHPLGQRLHHRLQPPYTFVVRLSRDFGSRSRLYFQPSF